MQQQKHNRQQRKKVSQVFIGLVYVCLRLLDNTQQVTHHILPRYLMSANKVDLYFIR